MFAAPSLHVRVRVHGFASFWFTFGYMHLLCVASCCFDIRCFAMIWFAIVYLHVCPFNCIELVCLPLLCFTLIYMRLHRFALLRARAVHECRTGISVFALMWSTLLLFDMCCFAVLCLFRIPDCLISLCNQESHEAGGAHQTTAAWLCFALSCVACCSFIVLRSDSSRSALISFAVRWRCLHQLTMHVSWRVSPTHKQTLSIVLINLYACI